MKTKLKHVMPRQQPLPFIRTGINSSGIHFVSTQTALFDTELHSDTKLCKDLVEYVSICMGTPHYFTGISFRKVGD